jgi:hypothetical protein
MSGPTPVDHAKTTWNPVARDIQSHGWFVFTTVLLMITAIFYIIMAVILPVVFGIATKTPGLAVYGLLSLIPVTLFFVIPAMTANTCRRHHTNDKWQ